MPKKGVVSWTMSDAAYAENFHDAESMALTVAGFENFFLVALDLETTRACVAKGMACVSTSTEQSSSLKTSVQMSKFSVSFWLARRGVDFVFFEMDVWFLKSMNDLFRESTTDVVVAAHQNNPTSANIGVYGVRGNNRTAEFFRTCIEESERDPDKHDQKIFHNVMTYHRLEYRGIQRDPTPWRDKPKSPRPASPISSAFIPPHVGVCSTHPVPTEASVFIHTLGTGPLKGQHGKKIHAKELGAWHGLGRTSANGTSYYGPLAHDGRTRYVALDGRPLMALSIDERDGYHNARWIKAHIAVLVAIARATQRVAILPKIIADYHVHFAWPFLDLQSLQGICDFRETNFAANRKSWKNATHAFTDVVQVSLRDTSVGLLSEDSRTTWQSFDPKQSWDAWAQTIHRPEELLLVHDAFVGHDFVRVLTNCESAAHCERDGVPRHFHSILSRLRWCGSDINLNRHVSVVFQGMDCYGTGITHQEQRKQLLEAKKKQKNNRKGL